MHTGGQRNFTNVCWRFTEWHFERMFCKRNVNEVRRVESAFDLLTSLPRCNKGSLFSCFPARQAPTIRTLIKSAACVVSSLQRWMITSVTTHHYTNRRIRETKLWCSRSWRSTYLIHLSTSSLFFVPSIKAHYFHNRSMRFKIETKLRVSSM